MTGNQETLAVLFADISGSAELFDRLGSEQAQQSISQCVGIMTRELGAFQGIVIKTISDEIMSTFPTAEQAFHAACAMSGAVESCKSQDGIPLFSRIGFHYGKVTRESGDVFGDTVNIAARIAAITRANQIIVTQAVFDVLPQALRTKMRQINRADLTSRLPQLDIFQVICNPDGESGERIGSPEQRKS